MNEFQIIIHEQYRGLLSLEELALAAGVHSDLAWSFLEYGLLEPVGYQELIPYFQVKDVLRIRTIQRLREDVGINLPGVAVVLDLIDKIRQLQAELEWYRMEKG